MLTKPSLLLKAEAACVMAGAVLLYARLHGSWGMFAVLFFVPDLFMLGYLAGPRVGAALYNLAHTYTLPLLLLGAGSLRAQPALITLALIWISHIAFDRLLGYGLKYPTEFKDTHVQHL